MSDIRLEFSKKLKVESNNVNGMSLSIGVQ